MSEKDLLNLPVVVKNGILSMLSIKEQLNFRLVSKGAKEWINGNGNLIAKNIPATVVEQQNDVTFTKFLKKKSKPVHLITNIYLGNETLDLFDDNLMPKFLRIHAPNITTLHLKRYYVNARNGNQLLFLEGFPNLKTFEVDEIWIASSGNTTESIKKPGSFQSLETLRLGRVIIYEESTGEIVTLYNDIPPDQKHISQWYVWNLIDFCVHLVYLRVPKSPKGLLDNNCDEIFQLVKYILRRTQLVLLQPRDPNAYLMRIDLYQLSSCRTASLGFLLVLGGGCRIQFLNVNTKFFKIDYSSIILAAGGTRNDYIHSLLSTYIITERMDFVVKITIKASLIENECIAERPQKGPHLLPHLLQIVIIIDIGFDPEDRAAVSSQDPVEPGITYKCFPLVDQVLGFFFPPNLEYASCHSLAIKFLEPIYPYQEMATAINLTCLGDIISCLPELTALTISGWIGAKSSYMKLWQGFPKLEKLTIEHCPSLDASCFVGGNGNPASISNFLFFQKLNFLELIGLETMPGMTTETGFGINILERFGLQPFSLLTNNEGCHRTSTWVRRYSSDDAVVMNQFTMVTRSAARSAAGNTTGADHKCAKLT